MLRKLPILLVSLLFTLSAQAEVWQARYGVAETFDFKLYNADGTLDVDEVDGGTEVSLSCNEGAETTATNDFVDEGTFYSIALTSGEMNCERIAVVIAATTTEAFFIQTSANASAMTPSYEVNVGTVTDGAFVAADFASDFLTAAKIASDVSTEFSAAVFTVNATQISGDSGAADALELAFDGTATGARLFGIDRLGTAAAVAAGTITLDAGAVYGDNTLTGATIWGCGSTQGYCQFNTVATNVGSTDVLTLSANWPVTPSGTVTYYLFGTAASTGGGGLDAAGVRAALGFASANADTQFSGIQSDTNDLQTRVPAALVSGRMDASVGAMAANVMTAAAAAADLATELQSGLATSSSIGTLQAAVDLIKAKTDQLLFGVTNTLNVNVEYMNAELVCGTGDAGTLWRGCP